MVAALDMELTIAVRVMAVGVRSVSSGPVTLVASHQLAQAIFNLEIT
jgi:hypothetical protein